VLAEVVKCKDAGVVKTKIDNFVQEGEEFLAQFKKVTAFERKRNNSAKPSKTHVSQDDPDAHAAGFALQETVQKATDAMKPQQLAKKIAGAMQRDGVPARTCWKWRDKGACAGHVEDTCGWEHPGEWYRARDLGSSALRRRPRTRRQLRQESPQRHQLTKLMDRSRGRHARIAEIFRLPRKWSPAQLLQ